MKCIWLDDQNPTERPAIACPAGWVQVFSEIECVKLLAESHVDALSLDCDLGAGGSGYGVALWLEDRAFHGNWAVVPEFLECHSANSVERQKDMAAFTNIERWRATKGD